MKPLLCTMFFVLFTAEGSFAQWYQQNSGTTKNLRDVAFLNAETAIAVGDSGIILRTTNSGTSWISITTAVTNDFTGMCFINENKGWAVAVDWNTNSFILHTTDGGSTWITQQTMSLTELGDIYFIDADNGWVTGWESIFSGFILRTTNGGTSWFQISNDIISANKIFFNDENNGWILDRLFRPLCWKSLIYKTTDGGNTFQTQMQELNHKLYDISFTDSQNGIVVGTKWNGGLWPGVIYRTTDGGESWLENLGPPFVECAFIDVFHISESVIAMWGNYNHGGNYDQGDVFYWSTDSGVTWQLRDSIQFILPLHINGIFFTDISNGWAVGDGGIILHTTNGGVTFVEGEQPNEAPTEFTLEQSYPNPFNPVTNIQFSIPNCQLTILKVYDMLGREVATLVNEVKQPGTYSVQWDAGGVASGVYFYRLQAGDFVASKKLMLMK